MYEVRAWAEDRSSARGAPRGGSCSSQAKAALTRNGSYPRAGARSGPVARMHDDLVHDLIT